MRLIFFILLSIAAVLFSSCDLLQDEKERGTSKNQLEKCEYSGVDYALGDRFDAEDGCNSCVCTAEGAACTEMGCIDSSGESSASLVGSCMYNDKIYADGALFSDGGCNECSCIAGAALCSKMPCSVSSEAKSGESSAEQLESCLLDGVWYDHGAELPDECGRCSCYDGNPTCLAVECPGEVCTYDGVIYEHGESFVAADGCNSCFCDNGGVGCTEMICEDEFTCGAICISSLGRYVIASEMGDTLVVVQGQSIRSVNFEGTVTLLFYQNDLYFKEIEVTMRAHSEQFIDGQLQEILSSPNISPKMGIAVKPPLLKSTVVIVFPEWTESSLCGSHCMTDTIDVYRESVSQDYVINRCLLDKQCNSSSQGMNCFMPDAQLCGIAPNPDAVPVDECSVSSDCGQGFDCIEEPVRGCQYEYGTTAKQCIPNCNLLDPMPGYGCERGEAYKVCEVDTDCDFADYCEDSGLCKPLGYCGYMPP